MRGSRRGRIFIVSNRLPELAAATSSVGGLVSALVPALASRGGGTWLGWDGKTGAKRTRVHAGRAGDVTTLAVTLPDAVVDGHYNRFCNAGLWPILHAFPGRFRADEADHEHYNAANVAFAKAVAGAVAPGEVVWVHDYHCIPMARGLRARGFRGPIGFFLHVPFPPPEIFAMFPWAREVLEDLARYDLVSFHTEEYARNFQRALLLEGIRAPRVGVHPIGIDPTPYEAWSREDSSVVRGKELRQAVLGRRLVLGVDRLDYTKGIPERLRIFSRLLDRHPSWRRRVSFIQISAPSRTRVPEYVKQRREVEELVGNVNGRHGDPDWVPIRYLFKAYDQRELAAFYREADVALVTPVRDGMNLVAKEFVAAQTGDPGVLVLSKFAGAAADLREALLVNPLDIDGSAEALAWALAMPLAERRDRQAALLARVRSRTAAWWAEAFLGDLTGGRRRAPRPLRV